MLDDCSQLNQFGVEMAWRQLQGIFKSNLLENTPDFSGLKVIFQTPQPSLGLKISLEWASEQDFHWEASQERTVTVDDDTYLLSEVIGGLGDWRDALLVMKLTGADLYGILQELKTAAEHLAPTIPTSDNQAKQLALYLAGKIGLVFSPEQTQTIGQFWRQRIEIQSRNLCFNQVITDLNPEGWSSHPVEKPFGVIDAVTTELDQASEAAFNRKNRQLSGKMPAARQLRLQTSSQASQLLEMMLLAEATSFYLACLNKHSLKSMLI